jgi:predicted nuclease of predicted toxin-antitoxin system
MDHHAPRAITNGLRLRGVDVLTAHEDGASRLRDPELLDRATELERVLFTQDNDLLTEATQRQGQTFSGVIYAHQLHMSIGNCVRDLEIIVQMGEPEDMTGQTLFLPL